MTITMGLLTRWLVIRDEATLSFIGLQLGVTGGDFSVGQSLFDLVQFMPGS